MQDCFVIGEGPGRTPLLWEKGRVGLLCFGRRVK